MSRLVNTEVGFVGFAELVHLVEFVDDVVEGLDVFKCEWMQGGHSSI